MINASDLHSVSGAAQALGQRIFAKEVRSYWQLCYATNTGYKLLVIMKFAIVMA